MAGPSHSRGRTFEAVATAGVILMLAMSGRAQTFPDTMWVPVIFYDFHPSGNNDFEMCTGNGITGMVQNRLGADRKPAPTSVACPSTASSFPCACHLSQWFRPSGTGGPSAVATFTNNRLTNEWSWTGLAPYQARAGEFVAVDRDPASVMANIVIYDSLPFVHHPEIGLGVYQFSRSGNSGESEFFWIDGRGYGSEPNGSNHNFAFTMELHWEFSYTRGLTFDFTGDDDVWAFVNDSLVMDLGGVHPTQSASFAVDNLGLEEGRRYSFDLFYAERHTDHSTIRITTNLFAPPSNLKLYGKPGSPGGTANPPLAARDTIQAGVAFPLYAHVFDSSQTWHPGFDSTVRWSILDAAGNTIALDSMGGTNAIVATEAFGTIRLVASFKDPNDPLQRTVTATINLYIAPGPADHLDIIPGPHPVNLLNDDSFDTLVFAESQPRDTVYAAIRDKSGNFIGMASSAAWRSTNTALATVTPKSGQTWQAAIEQRGGGFTSVVASQSGLIPDTLALVLHTTTVSLLSAVTGDTDGNGYLDRITLTFDSLIELPSSIATSGISVKYGPTRLTVNAIRSRNGGADSVVVLYLQEEKTRELQTGWLPTVTIPAQGTVPAITGVTCADGAGPVAARAVLFRAAPGGVSGAHDTLRIFLSEPVVWTGSLASPGEVFAYYDSLSRNDGAFAGIAARDMAAAGDSARILMTNDFVVTPFLDSVRLVTTPRVTDRSGNLAPENGRKAPIELGSVGGLAVTTLGNPFIAGGASTLPPQVRAYYSTVLTNATSYQGAAGVLVAIESPQPLRPQSNGSYGTATIYDAVGNIVIDKLRLDQASPGHPSEFGVFWDGHNRNGRLVGGGAYLMVLTTTDINGKTTIKRTKVGVRIGK